MTMREVRLKPLFYEATTSISPEPWMAKAILTLLAITLYSLGQVCQLNSRSFILFILLNKFNFQHYSSAISLGQVGQLNSGSFILFTLLGKFNL